MKGYVHALFCLVTVIGLVGMISLSGFSQETEGVATMELKGKIASVDPANSALVVTWLKDATNNVTEDVTVSVNSSTNIEKNEEMIGIDQLEVGNNVYIEYTTDAAGKKIASYIMVGGKE